LEATTGQTTWDITAGKQYGLPETIEVLNDDGDQNPKNLKILLASSQ
jgi:hypothetical protein